MTHDFSVQGDAAPAERSISMDGDNASALDQVAGVIFGECSDCNPGDGYGSLTLEQILDDYLLPLEIPAYRGAMIGHLREQFIVPVGGKVELDADAGTFRLLEPVFQA